MNGEWIPAKDLRPVMLEHGRHSAWVSVFVVWCNLSFEMDGALILSDGSWTLTNYPPGYGGPATTNRGKGDQRPAVLYWRPKSPR